MPVHKKLIFLLLLFSFSAAAGSNLIYYDSQWQPTRKNKAHWYRSYTLKDGVYKVEDHYISGELYMTGYRTTIESNSCIYRVGKIVFYDRAGHKMREGQYDHGVRTGTWKYYYRNSDALDCEYHYDNDSEHVDYSLSYDSSTQRLTHRSTEVGPNKTGNWDYTANDSIYSEVTRTDSAGAHFTITRYKDHINVRKESRQNDTGKLHNSGTQPQAQVTENCYDDKGKEIECSADSKKVFNYVEQMPRFNYDLREYFSKSIRYPSSARRAGIEGRVIIKFVVDEDGAIANPRVIKGIDSDCDAEALRVVSEMPCLQPGLQNGRPIRVTFTQPIGFKLQ